MGKIAKTLGQLTPGQPESADVGCAVVGRAVGPSCAGEDGRQQVTVHWEVGMLERFEWAPGEDAVAAWNAATASLRSAFANHAQLAKPRAELGQVWRFDDGTRFHVREIAHGRMRDFSVCCSLDEGGRPIPAMELVEFEALPPPVEIGQRWCRERERGWVVRVSEIGLDPYRQRRSARLVWDGIADACRPVDGVFVPLDVNSRIDEPGWTVPSAALALSDAFEAVARAMGTPRGREVFVRDVLAACPSDLAETGWRAVVLRYAETITSFNVGAPWRVTPQQLAGWLGARARDVDDWGGVYRSTYLRAYATARHEPPLGPWLARRSARGRR